VNALEAVLRSSAEELRGRGVGFALVGGLAVSVRAEPRFTRDLDLAIAVDSDEEAESVLGGFLSHGWRMLSQIEEECHRRLASARLSPPEDVTPLGVVLDLLFASSGIEPELVEAAESVRVFEDLEIPVSRVGHLIALKILAQDPSGRPQDRLDARALLGVADPAALDQARASLDRIRELGCHRGKDLRRELDFLLAERRP